MTDPPGPGDGAPARPGRAVALPGRTLALLDRHRPVAVGVLTTWLVAVAVAPVASTPYRSDDRINSTVPDGFDTGLWGALCGGASWVAEVTGLWMHSQGRFFPGSAAWTMTVFGVARSEAAYKVLLAVLSLAMLLLAGAVMATLTRTGAAVPVVVVTTAGTLTLRPWFDGLDTFSGVVPLTVCLTLGALLLLLRGRSPWSAGAAVALWSYALVTYEVAILLTPVLCLVVWWHRRSRNRAVLPLLPAAVVGLVVLLLRTRVDEPAERYAVALDPLRVLGTYAKQAVAPLPLAQVWFPGAELPVPRDGALLGVMLVVVGLPVAVLLLCVARGRGAAGAQRLGLGAVLGAATWWCTPLLVAVSAGWQETLPRGQGYLAVVWGYVGVGMLAGAGWLALARRWAVHRSRGSTAALVLASVVLAVTVAATCSLSIGVARTLVVPVA